MAKVDKILGSISPAYGMISGQGAFSPLKYMSPAMMAVGTMKKKKGKDGTTTTTEEVEETGMRHGGKVKKMAKGGSTASKRADGCCTKGKTKGRMV
jgi:hypothetical protein